MPNRELDLEDAEATIVVGIELAVNGVGLEGANEDDVVEAVDEDKLPPPPPFPPPISRRS